MCKEFLLRQGSRESETADLTLWFRQHICGAAHPTAAIQNAIGSQTMPASHAIQKLGLVIPTLNEAGNIEPLLERVRASLDPLGISYEVLIVDDGSVDGTQEAAQRCSERDQRVRLLVRYDEKGLAGAVIHGWKHTDADLLGVMDAAQRILEGTSRVGSRDCGGQRHRCRQPLYAKQASGRMESISPGCIDDQHHGHAALPAQSTSQRSHVGIFHGASRQH